MKRRKNDNCPSHVTARAARLVNDFRRGAKNYTILKSCRYLKIDIGIHWRLLSKDSGHTWALLAHSNYDKEILK